MQRRKFIAGLGSLAAAGAAGIGTGAVSSVESTRAVDADVVSDANGTLGLLVSGDTLENSQVASHNDGQLSLQFDGASSTELWSDSSEGLNPDSTYWFDNVFTIANRDSEDLHVSFDDSQLDNSDAFTFYLLRSDGGLIGSRSNLQTSAQISSGASNNVGIKIETPDSVVEDWETGSLVIRGDHPEDVNIN